MKYLIRIGIAAIALAGGIKVYAEAHQDEPVQSCEHQLKMAEQQLKAYQEADEIERMYEKLTNSEKARADAEAYKNGK